jgi:DnaJ-class molecular chaperone
MEPTDNPYAILGITESATARDIRTAYRRLALEHHPDRNPNNTASHTLFAKINHAYEVLTDPERSSSWKQNHSNNGPSNNTMPHRQYYHSDPFSVFESVFRDEFISRDFFRPRGMGGFRNFPSMFEPGRDPFDDPFFTTRRSSRVRNNNNNDDMFGAMEDWFRSSPFEDAMKQSHLPPAGQSSSSFYSSSSFSRRNSKGQWVTETTENRNGDVTTERITRDAQGNILQQETLEQGQEGGTTGSGGPKKRLSAAPVDQQRPHHNKFRLPWRRGDE